jgi:hypothetical protein
MTEDGRKLPPEFTEKTTVTLSIGDVISCHKRPQVTKMVRARQEIYIERRQESMFAVSIGDVASDLLRS